MRKTGMVMLVGIVAPTLLATTVAAEDPLNDNSHVTANVNSGGLKLEVKDAILGDLVIGQTINPVTVEGLAIITDHTGGNGWELTVKNASYETNKNTLEVGLTMDESIKLTGESQKIATGLSTLTSQDKKGTFTADWGATPSKGAYSSELNWTLTPAMRADNIFDEYLADENTNSYFTGIGVTIYDNEGVAIAMMAPALDDGEFTREGDNYKNRPYVFIIDPNWQGEGDQPTKDEIIENIKTNGATYDLNIGMYILGNSEEYNAKEFIEKIELFGIDVSSETSETSSAISEHGVNLIYRKESAPFTSLDELTNMKFDFFITNSNPVTLDYEMNLVTSHDEIPMPEE